MDLNQIRYFLNLAQSLNFTEAARQSGVSQPSLTRAIQRLEEELGAPLLYRDGKDSRLTALGRDIQLEFMQIEASLNAVAEIADNSIIGERRRLAIGIATTIAPVTTADFWRYVLTQLPVVELQFFPLLPGEAATEVLSGRYDMCLLTNPPKPNVKLTTLPIYRESPLPGHGFRTSACAQDRDYAGRNVGRTVSRQIALRVQIDTYQTLHGSQYCDASALPF